MRHLVLSGIAAVSLSGCPLDSNKVAAPTQAATAPVPAQALGANASSFVAPSGSASGPLARASAPIERGSPSAQPLASARGAYNDANADGRSDLVWAGDLSGLHVAHWLMNGNQVMRTLSPTPMAADSHVISTGDFDGDKRVDQLWLRLERRGGSLTLGRLNEAGSYEHRHVAGIGDGWLLDRSADLNGDGRSDAIWTNRTLGRMAYWLMNGTAILSSGVYPLDVNNYALVAVGDFDGDGREDLLWRGRQNSAYYMWRSRSDGHFDQSYVGTVPAGWVLDAVVDLNADTRSDLVWTNRDANQMAYWWMNGAAPQRTGVIGADTERYTIAACGDFDGDGKGDLVWATRRDATAASLYLWRSRGDGSFDPSFISTYDDSVWQPMPPYADA
ncbi:VCBS repeat-containing protein [Lysobacter sp. Root983]|uniref:FG-GAP repeat domain-containing protein n=1 Tax=Lysobacter sp. Root983 TaxID=1736613 RepID=UPI0009ECA9B3|nr:VCBS repeat-containing protein [Lysobacter sp. Root983]